MDIITKIVIITWLMAAVFIPATDHEKLENSTGVMDDLEKQDQTTKLVFLIFSITVVCTVGYVTCYFCSRDIEERFIHPSFRRRSVSPYVSRPRYRWDRVTIPGTTDNLLQIADSPDAVPVGTMDETIAVDVNN